MSEQYKNNKCGNDDSSKCVDEDNLCYKCERGNRCKRACLAITECERYIGERKEVSGDLNDKRTAAWLRGKDISGNKWWNKT